jgi:subtilase family serine protease
MFRKITVFLLGFVTILSVVTLNAVAQYVLTRYARDVKRGGKAQSVGRLCSAQVLQLDVVLPLRDQAGLNSFLKNLYYPNSPPYRYFLTVKEFTAKFGPTQKNYEAVAHDGRL